ncbi:MAG: hypothetical protein HYW27_04105 [Candidatus Aenigmarchaeota archaeon]|nr:hypothetical protein [Candidatus Aenigmarchaeota archaeon]
MQCPVCGSTGTKVRLQKHDIICSQCGTPFHVDGGYFGYGMDDYNF